MKQLTQYIQEKLQISSTSKVNVHNTEDESLKDFCIVYAANSMYDEMMEYFEDALIVGTGSPNIFVVKKDDIESYISVSDFEAYEFPKEYKTVKDLGDFEDDYKSDYIDLEDLEKVDFKNYFK